MADRVAERRLDSRRTGRRHCRDQHFMVRKPFADSTNKRHGSLNLTDRYSVNPDALIELRKRDSKALSDPVSVTPIDDAAKQPIAYYRQ